MTSLTDIIKKSEAAFKAFETTNKHPTNLYITQIYDAITKIFTPYITTVLVPSTTWWGWSTMTPHMLPSMTSCSPIRRRGIYASEIDTTKYASLEIRKKESFQKATIANWEIYNVDKSEANGFIARVVADVWICPLS